MASIKYTQKIEAKEIETAFGGSKIVDTEEAKIEFDYNALNAEQKALWDSVRPSFGNVVTLRTHRIERLRSFKSVKSEIVSTDYIADASLTLDEALAHISASQAELQRLQDEIQPELDDIAAKIRADKEAEQRLKAAEQQRKEQAAAGRLEAAKTIAFANGSSVVNLAEQVRLVSGLSFDSRYNSWIKRVDSIDRASTNGYMYEGDFVNDGTQEVQDKPAVFLIASRTGSRKHNSTDYRVVTLRNGNLELTDIQADDGKDSGWALLIREQIQALLDEQGNQEDEFAALREAIRSDNDEVTVSRELLEKLLNRAGV